jgi:hypothetical protein
VWTEIVTAGDPSLLFESVTLHKKMTFGDGNQRKSRFVWQWLHMHVKEAVADVQRVNERNRRKGEAEMLNLFSAGGGGGGGGAGGAGTDGELPINDA